jgi:Leucine-rich repeat (LRR) protein
MIDIRVPDPKKRLQNAYARAKQKGVLRLGNMNLQRFPEEIHRFNEYTLEGENWWEDIPLAQVDLSNNPIPEIDPRITKLKELVVLKIINAQIKQIPPEIFSCEILKVLDLAGNMIEVIPDEVGNATHLAELNLSKNRIKALPALIGNLKNLDNLFMTGNGITSLPREVRDFF